MNKKRFFLIVAALGMAGACAPLSGLPSVKDIFAETPTAKSEAGFPAPTLVPAENIAAQGPVLLSGEFDYTNEFYPEEYAYEHAVSLLDMTGFVHRDEEWKMPVTSQVLGYVKIDPNANHGEFRLMLPARPAGTMNDVDNDGQTDTGLQIFALAYTPNWSDGPFYEGNDVFIGWPSYLASLKADSENNDEVTGGKLILWAPDDQQSFPSAFGADGLLFSADDPQMPLPAGYSVVDLDQKPFALSRNPEERLTLYEPSDVAIKDYSDLSYSNAFEKMFAVVRKEYAFTDIAGKAPDWDKLYAEIAPRVQAAEKGNKPYDYFLALRDFSLAFRDGHVSIDAGDLADDYTIKNIVGGYGFAIRELDDGRALVVYILPNGPADKAGMLLGAEVTQFNDTPIGEAIGNVKPFSAQSTDYGLRYEQAIFLLRCPENTSAKVTFKNPGAASQSVTLKSTWEFDSLYATYMGGSSGDPNLPVDFKYLDDTTGYISVNSNSDDLNLTYRLFQRALRMFKENEVTGLVIDLRNNTGGSSLGLAGFFTDEEIPMGQLEYYSEKTGKFEPEGTPDKVLPNDEQYHFDKMALLVDQFCYSACELEAYGFSRLPEIAIVGYYPTAGVEAETARGEFDLPEKITLTVPTGRFVLPDGSIFLEGKGVEPTVQLKITAESVLSKDDPALQKAHELVLGE